MKREKQIQKLDSQVKDFLKKNPAIEDALRVFDISYDQYQKAMESGYNFYTDTSTFPRYTRFRKSI